MISTQKSTIHFLNLQFQYDIGMHFFHEKSTQKYIHILDLHFQFDIQRYAFYQEKSMYSKKLQSYFRFAIFI